MTDRFIKFIPSEEAYYLLLHKFNAYKLLTIIATRARREAGHPDGLLPGQAHIGDWENMAMSRQTYRSSLAILIGRGHVKIIETNRTRKKSTTGTTTAGTLVEILSTTIYDINKIVDNHPVNHCPTTDQPRTRKNKKEKEEEKINKKEKSPAPPKIAFRENALLTQEEYDKLIERFGVSKANAKLDNLSNYKASSGKSYESDYHTILVWENMNNKPKIKETADAKL